MAGGFVLGKGMIGDDDGDEDSDDPLSDNFPNLSSKCNIGEEYDDELMGDINLFPKINFIPSEEIICAPVESYGKVVKNYLLGKVLGEGAYGKVKEALDIYSLHRRAIKILKKRKLRRIPKGEENVKREICMLKRIKHKNVIHLVDVMFNSEKEKIYIVMEYCVCSMYDVLQHAPEKRFPEWQGHFYFTQLVVGLDYLHGVGIIHKDVKPSNLLITTDKTLKICDFGVAQQLDPFAPDDSCSSSQGSPMFQPPEIANGVDVFSGFKLDIWAAGVTLFNIITGKYPYEGKTIYDLFINIGKGDLVLPTNLNRELESFLRGVLHSDFKKRFSIAQLQVHSWYTRSYYKYEEEINFPIVDREFGDLEQNMTTIPYLDLFNNDEFVLVEDHSRVPYNNSEQTSLKFLENSNHVLVRQASSLVSDSDSENIDVNRKTRRGSKTRKYTPNSCKAQ